MAKQTLQDVVSMTLAARKAYGASTMLVATKACEFIRMVTGGDDTEICIAGGYYCQDCETQPVHDFKWWSCENTGELDGMFCAANGCAYDKGRMAGLIAFADKQNPEKSFVVKTRMPSGKTANLLSAIKLVNMIRLGEFPFSDEETRRHGGIGEAIKSFIAEDNERYYRNFDMLRGVAKSGTITYPAVDRDCYPEFRVSEEENSAFLRSCDSGDRGFIYFDVGELFDNKDEPQPPDCAWIHVLNAIVERWSLAEAVCIEPHKLNEYTGCSIRTLKQLKNWIHIRVTGHWPPIDDSPPAGADATDRAWAAEQFIVFGKTGIPIWP